MAINYSLVKLASKFGDKAGVPKFYARAQMNESISLKKFAKLISMQTTVSYADVTAVLVSMQVPNNKATPFAKDKDIRNKLFSFFRSRRILPLFLSLCRFILCHNLLLYKCFFSFI